MRFAPAGAGQRDTWFDERMIISLRLAGNGRAQAPRECYWLPIPTGRHRSLSCRYNNGRKNPAASLRKSPDAPPGRAAHHPCQETITQIRNSDWLLRLLAPYVSERPSIGVRGLLPLPAQAPDRQLISETRRQHDSGAASQATMMVAFIEQLGPPAVIRHGEVPGEIFR